MFGEATLYACSPFQGQYKATTCGGGYIFTQQQRESGQLTQQDLYNLVCKFVRAFFIKNKNEIEQSLDIVAMCLDSGGEDINDDLDTSNDEDCMIELSNRFAVLSCEEEMC